MIRRNNIRAYSIPSKPASALLPALTACLALSACHATNGDNAPQVQRVSVSDSAGIQIVTSSAPAWATGDEWTLAETPEAEIGRDVAGAEYQLHRVVDATRLSDGRIVVAENGSGSLRYYDSSGKFIRSAGRAGTGPGEFGSISSVHRLRGDTILVLDNRNSLVLFDGLGDLLTSRKLQGSGVVLLNIIGVFLDGTMVQQLGGEGYKPDPADVGKVVFRLLSRDDVTRFRVDYPRGRERKYAQFEDAANVTYANVMGIGDQRPILDRYHHLQTSVYSAPGPQYLFVGDSDRFEFHAFNAEGKLARIIRIAATPEPILASVKRDTAQFQIGGATYTAREVIWPDHYPPFRRVIADKAGNLWATKVRRAGESMDTTRYTIVDSSGAWLGEMALPSYLNILEIGASHVVSHERDPLGVEMIRLYRISRRR